MLFNSWIYILLFLPSTLVLYFALNRFRMTGLGSVFLVSASLFFYAWYNPSYLALIVISIVFNYTVGIFMNLKFANTVSFGSVRVKKILLVTSVIGNLSSLAYYKYSDFFISNVNSVFSANFHLLKLALPLAISFFTFQQIAYLVDSYNNQTKEYSFSNYCLFVTFFPQLIAGPIVHHAEMMPQFSRLKNKLFNWKNISAGTSLFIIGLFKKVVIADTFAVWADWGYANCFNLSFFEAWGVTLSYTFQLYFDFSGYTDMALGSALLFNIRLPLNFNSPYKALNIQDFWRRWHMTLSRWLRDYLYVPLGGSKDGNRRTYINLFLTFLIGGLWHGAGWTFVAWGAMHGAGTAIHKMWQVRGLRLSKFAGWATTFLFVHISWVFFRAANFDDALMVLRSMVGANGVHVSGEFASLFDSLTGVNLASISAHGTGDGLPLLSALLLFSVWVLACKAKNSVEFVQSRINFVHAGHLVTLAVMAFACYLFSIKAQSSPFLYFNF
jgi:alginate O-acetyltransferase complex protein AlgI